MKLLKKQGFRFMLPITGGRFRISAYKESHRSRRDRTTAVCKLPDIQLSFEAEKSGDLPWRVIPEISGAGHFFDLGSHQLDFLDYIFGPVKKVSSLAVNQAGMYDAEDFVAASIPVRQQHNSNGNMEFCIFPRSQQDYFEIAGDKGIIKTSTFTYAPIVVVNSSGTKEFANERPENIQFYLIEQIVRLFHKEEMLSAQVKLPPEQAGLWMRL
jgi:predicted dehydrogenase